MIFSPLGRLVALTLLIASFPSASAFSFNTTTPTQCNDFTVSWNGGTAPFYLVLVPTIEVAAGRILNISIPTDVSSNTYTFQLSEPSGLEFIATMYDATGWGSGGTTAVLTVGSSSSTSCLVTNLLYDFTFSISPTSAPAQCSNMAVIWENNVTYPVDLYGLIPSGSAFSLPIAQTSSDIEYNWRVNIASGTQFLLLMADSGTYQTGGSTGLLTVGSGSSSCINASSPHIGSSTSSSSMSSTSTTSSTASSSSASSTFSVSGVGGSSSGGSSSGGTANADGSQSSTSTSSSNHTGAIVGGVVGGVAFLALLALLLFCCVRRRSRSRRNSIADPALKSYGVASGTTKAEKRRSPVDIIGTMGPQDSDEMEVGGDETRGLGRPMEANGEMYQPSPFRYPSPTDSPTAAINGTPGTPGTNATTGEMIGLGSAGVLAGSSEKAAQDSHRNHVPIAPALPAEIPYSSRPSLESVRTAGTTNETNDSSTGIGAVPPTVVSGTSGTQTNARSDAATLGHVTRNSSIRKTPLVPQPAPASPGTPRVPTDGARPSPDAPARDRETRFVQHEDAGEVVDLPPRYDQLRPRNPDSGET